MPTKKPSRPLYEVFLERVIRIEAVQRYRAAVTEEHTADFFELGRIPGEIGTFRWSLEAPEPFPQGIVIADYEQPPMLPAMQAAWDAAVAAWKEFVGALRNGELIAVARHPATGEHHELDPAEWSRTGLVLDVRNGDLLCIGLPEERVRALQDFSRAGAVLAVLPETALERFSGCLPAATIRPPAFTSANR